MDFQTQPGPLLLYRRRVSIYSRIFQKIPKISLELSRYLTFIDICWRPQNWNRILSRPSRIKDSRNGGATPLQWPILELRNTTRSSSPIQKESLPRTRGPGCVLKKFSKHNPVFQSYGWRLSIYIGLEDRVVFRKTILMVSSLFFCSFYCNNHLLRSESSKQKHNGFQNTTRSSSPIYGDSPSIQDQRTGLCFGQ